MKIQVTDHPTCPHPSLMPQPHSDCWGKPRQGRRQAWLHIPSLEFGVPARRKYRSQLSSAKQVTGTAGVTARTCQPDLKHTFIQQTFIKRLFVQGTSGEAVCAGGTGCLGQGWMARTPACSPFPAGPCPMHRGHSRTWWASPPRLQRKFHRCTRRSLSSASAAAPGSSRDPGTNPGTAPRTAAAWSGRRHSPSAPGESPGWGPPGMRTLDGTDTERLA